MLSPHGLIAPHTARWRAAGSFLGAVTLVCSLVVGVASLGCGRILATKGPGEPCTRTTECRSDLVCTAGVCTPGPDSGRTPLDAGEPAESGALDAGESEDVGAGETDAGETDADLETTEDASAAEDAGATEDAGVAEDAEAADVGSADAP